jgi:hypothetical protein
MSNSGNIGARDLERIFAGKRPLQEGHEDLLLLVQKLQAAFPEQPLDKEVEKAHMAAIMQEARLIPEKGDPVARPGSKAAGPAMQASGLPETRRKSMLTALFTSLAAKIAASVLVGFSVLGGAAVAGALPDPAQSAVARAAAYVGVALPVPEVEAEVGGAPEDLNLPEEANVPSTVPVGAGASGAPAVPDHVTLPEEANVPDTVPVGAGAPDSAPAPAQVPAELPVPQNVLPVEAQAQVPTELPVKRH